jgi:Concanavalin A-like lectin/glucanases superfamily
LIAKTRSNVVAASMWTLAAVVMVGGCAEESPAIITPGDSPIDSLTVTTVADLPTCTEGTSGRVAYVKDVKALYACVDGQWTPVPLTPGPAGPAGPEGAPGPAGPAGDAGPAGATSRVKITNEPPGANCENGGVRIDAGADTNGNGVLDTAEIQTTGYVCHVPLPCGSLQIPNGGGAIVNASAAVLLSTGNYCYEAWARLDGSKPSPGYLAACTASNNCNAILSIRNDLGYILYAVQTPAGAILATASISAALNPGDNAWHHIAGCRAINGTTTTLTLYWDGQLVGTAMGLTSTIGTPTDLRLASTVYAPNDGLGGYLDEVRVSNTLRYAANFAPQARLSADASTVLMLHFDGADGTTFRDSSAGARTGTMSGLTTFSPTVCR